MGLYRTLTECARAASGLWRGRAASSKVQVEGLINEQLKAEPTGAGREDRLYEQIAHLMQLRNNMSAMQEQNRGSLKTMVDPAQLFVQARMCACPP